MPYPDSSGSVSGFSSLPNGWTVGVINGLYTISYNGVPVQQSALTGTTLASSVSTGVGSFHLGQSHSIGAAGQNVTFKNGHTNICWFPVWQGQSADGSTVISPSARILSSTQTVYELNGAVNLSSTPMPYTVTDTITQALAGAGNTGMSFTQAIMYPAETYSGNITWTVSFQSDGIQIANVVLTGGSTNKTPLTINFDYPLDVRVNDVIVITMTKADGTTLLCYGGATVSTQPYRKLTYRTFADGLVAAAGSASDGKGNSVTTIADPTNLNQTTVTLASSVQPYYLLTAGNGLANSAAKNSIRAWHGDTQSSLEYNQTAAFPGSLQWARLFVAYNSVNNTRFFAVNIDSVETHRQTTTSHTFSTATGTAGASVTRLLMDPNQSTIYSPNGTNWAYIDNNSWNVTTAGQVRIALTNTQTTFNSQNGNAQIVLDNNNPSFSVNNYTALQAGGSTNQTYLSSTSAGGKSITLSPTTFTGTAAYQVTSDKTLKTEMQAIPDTLLDVWTKYVKFGSYQMLDEGENGKRHIGVYAQDIIAAFTAAGLNWEEWGIVSKDDPETHYSVSYNDVMVIEMAFIRRKLDLIK